MAAAIVGVIGLGLSAPAWAASGYPGTTTVTSVPGGSSSPGAASTPSGPSDPCATNPGACSSTGGNSPAASTNAATSGTGSSGTAGTLAFTGADLLALIVGAVFLLAVGTLLVVFTRRRASHQQV
jgi:hypothetical protein